MQCPKCSGGTFLSDEELVKVMEGPEPHRILIKAMHTCMSCQERFSRLVWDELGPHRRHAPQGQAPYQQPQQPSQPNPYQQYQQPQQQQRQEEPVVDGLKFF